MQRMAILFYDSKFSEMTQFLGTNVAFVKWVHCIIIIIILIIIIIIIMIIAKHEETALALFLIFLSFIDWFLRNSLTFPDFCINSKIPWQISKFPDNSLTLKKYFFPWLFPWPWTPWPTPPPPPPPPQRKNFFFQIWILCQFDQN